jgi:D-aspartate ligase
VADPVIAEAPPARLPPAVVVGLDNVTGLQTARLLARRGVPVVGVVGTRGHFSARSRLVSRVVRSPLSGAPLVQALEALAGTLDRRAVLVPCTDLAVLTLSQHGDELGERYNFVQPEPNVAELLMDKVRFAHHASASGLAIPQTHVLECREDAEAAAARLAYPAVLKPPVKTVEWQRSTREKAIPVDGPDELLAAYDRCAAWASPLLVQEWIDGEESDLYSCNCYYDRESQPLATFIARKIRQWPPQTGTSSLGEECRNDEVLAESLRLFSSVGYRGLGYVEMKRDRRTGKHFIIEANVGRPTGRSAIAEAGGVELLYTAYADAARLPLPSARTQRYGGAKWIYLRHDLQSALHYWRRGELGLHDWLRSLKGVRSDAVLSLTDPLPFAADLLQAARKGLGPGRRAR